jgi:hypothetical protein
MIVANMKLTIKPKICKIARDQSMNTAVATMVPDIVADTIITTTISYVISNKHVIMRKPLVMLHPKKIAKAAPSPLIGFMLNSGGDMLLKNIDTMTHDHTLHLAAQSVIAALKFALTII